MSYCSLKCWSRLALALLLMGSVARAQTAPLAVANVEELSRVLEQGARLESERRWADALTYYEDANKHHPERPELQQRLSLAKAHYDIERRYGDASFTTAVGTMSARQAIDLYDEILTKIQTNHYQQTDWARLFNRGVLHLEVSLDEPIFVSRNAPAASREALFQFRQELAQFAASRKVTDKNSTRDAAAAVAKLTTERLNMPSSAALLEFACGAAGSLDEYSGFLTGSQVDEVFSQIEGNFVGLGVELKADNNTLLIVNTIPGGPAEQGGLKSGDRITGVDGKTTQQISTDVAADMLRGEEGTVVAVTVVSALGTQRTLRLTRRRVEVPSVEDVKLVDRRNGVGYFKLTSFQKTTNRDVDAALWKLHAEGMRSLIIDLRGNPGGLLRAAVDVADKFVNEGLIVATRGRSQREDYDHRGQTAGTWRVPLVILIDKDSASASEILAGAVRDHGRGTIVGQKSYGKGSVQGIFPLTASNAGIRLTTAQWFTPAGHAISGKGIVPDTVVQVTAKPVTDGVAAAPMTPDNDAILRAGMEAAKELMARRATPAAQQTLKN